MPAASAESELLRIEIEQLDEEGMRLARQALVAFVAGTYGSFRDAPIERGPQGEVEGRADLE